MTPAPVARLGLLWRQNPSAEMERARLQPIFSALADLHVDTVPVLYSDDTVAAARDQLLQLDGVLVWVDPIAYGQDRSRLDALLREVAAEGVWVSAHPDVILKMGTKEVLVLTRDLGWGTDTDLYRTQQEFRERFPSRLAMAASRVLKQYRGNGGQGVWKVALLTSEPPAGGREDARENAQTPSPYGLVRVLEARRNSLEEDVPLGEFLDRCAGYFAGSGRLIDQPFQERLPEGMIRCYLSQDTIIGFTHQLIRGLMPASADSDATALPQPGPRIVQPATTPGFEVLKQKMESEWIPAMCETLGLDRRDLPALWDADFLFGPKKEPGEDTYVLCEINVSCVTPYPEFAAAQIAKVAVDCALAAK
jgi:hypothetical protein